MGDISKRVLVVDDKEINRLSAKVLETQGYAVETAPDFLTALKLLSGMDTGERIHCYFEHPSIPKHGILLTDMMFPFGGRDGEFVTMGMAEYGDATREKEMSLGYPLALYAAKIGVSKIAIISSTNHHMGPISATFDLFAQKWDEERRLYLTNRFKIQNSDFMMFVNPDREPKNWAGALELLLK